MSRRQPKVYAKLYVMVMLRSYVKVDVKVESKKNILWGIVGVLCDDHLLWNLPRTYAVLKANSKSKVQMTFCERPGRPKIVMLHPRCCMGGTSRGGSGLAAEYDTH